MMRFRLLGPVEVRAGEDWRGIGAPKWRSVLAALLIPPGQIVSAGTLIGELWRDDPPARAGNLVSIYVLRLRRLMDDPDGHLLVTRAPGYLLRVAGDDTDALLFEAMVRDGRRAFAAGDPGGAPPPADRGPRSVAGSAAGRRPADAAGRGGGRTARGTPPRRRRAADHGRTRPRGARPGGRRAAPPPGRPSAAGGPVAAADARPGRRRAARRGIGGLRAGPGRHLRAARRRPRRRAAPAARRPASQGHRRP